MLVSWEFTENCVYTDGGRQLIASHRLFVGFRQMVEKIESRRIVLMLASWRLTENCGGVVGGRGSGERRAQVSRPSLTTEG